MKSKDVKKKKEGSQDRWIDYYCSLLSKECQCVYIYISPEGFIEKDAAKTLPERYCLQNSEKSVVVFFC